MLRGVAIHRVFVLVDLALVGFVLAVTTLVVVKVFEEAANPYAAPAPRVAAALDPGKVLHDVPERAHYDGIIKSRIFGPAGDETPDTPPPPAPPEPPPTEDVEETELNLALRGTVAIAPLHPLASATIENKDTKKTDVFGLGDDIVEGEEVLLEEVYPREVIISNKGKREVLRMDDEAAVSALAKKTPPGGRPNPRQRPAAPPERFTLNKQEFIKELYVNYAELVNKVKPTMHYDENGDMDGITASNIEDVPLAKTLDLNEGDVLQSINGQMIDSPEKIIQLINENRDKTMFRIGIMRDGRQVSRTYRLE